MKSKEEILKEFLKEREVLGFRDKRTMRKQVRKLFSYLEERELGFEDVKLKEAQEYQGWLIEKGTLSGEKYATGTIHNYMKGATRFYGYLKKKGVIYVNPFLVIRKKRLEKRIPRDLLKESEMYLVLKKLREFDEERGLKNQKTRYRMYVIAELMYSTGMRIGEVASLREGDIDFDRGTVSVKDIKDSHEKVVFLNEYTKEVLKIYLSMRGLILNEFCNKGLLFGTKADGLSTLMNQSLKKISEELKLPVITSHGFRHSFGYHFLRSGCDIRYIQELLGHKRIRTTEVYTKVDKEDLKKILEEYHPRKLKRR